MQAALHHLALPFPRLFPWVESLIERLQSKDEYLRMLKWNRALDAFMGSAATYVARVRIREALDEAVAEAGFAPADVWRGAERFTDGRAGGELLEGTRVYQDPLSGQKLTAFIRLQAHYDGRLACVLAAATADEEAPHLYTRTLFSTQAQGLPNTGRLPWGVAQSFTAAFAAVLADQGYATAIREACIDIRREMDEALTP